MYSAAVGDSVPVKIWLPADFKPEKTYTVIYDLVYDHSSLIAASAANIWDMPKCIVIHPQIEAGNEHYRHPQLAPKGQKYYRFLKDELIPAIKKEYKTGQVTVGIGHSQGADYLNYILRNDPSLFNAYLLFSLERPVYYKPDYASYHAKISGPLTYYLGIAGNDIPERKTFAATLYDSLKTVSSLDIKKAEYPGADHGYGIMYGLTDGLLFAFRDYPNAREKRPEETFPAYFSAVIKEKETKYGSCNFNALAIQLMEQMDSSILTNNGVAELLNTVYRYPGATDLDFVNIGYMFRQQKLYEAAEQSYELALKKKKESGTSKLDNITAHFQLFKVYDLQNKTAEALKRLQKAYEATQEPGVLARLGEYYIIKNIDVKKGISILHSINGRTGKDTFWDRPQDWIFEKIAQGYKKLSNKKEALYYANKSLAANPDNKEAKQLKKDLR